MTSSLSMWAIFDGVLLRGLVSYLDEDDVYRLWIFAEESRLKSVCTYLTSDFDELVLSPTRARHLAIGYACWTAVCRLSDTLAGPSHAREKIEAIIREIHRVVVPLRDHPDRDRAMTTVATIDVVPEFAMYFAARQGTLESVILLHAVARYDPAEALHVAARHGQDHVIIWLLDNLPTARRILTSSSVESVFRYEDDPALGVLAWRVTCQERSRVSAYTKKWGFVCASRWGYADHDAIDLPAMHGDLESLQQMLSYDAFKDSDLVQILRNAAGAGHLHVVEWLFDSFKRVCSGGGESVFYEPAYPGSTTPATGHAVRLSRTFTQVVRNGHTQLLQWLDTAFPNGMQNPYWIANSYYLGVACERGHLETVRWFVETRAIPVTRNLLASAAKGGHKRLFEWLHERLDRDTDGALVWDSEWLDKAAQGGDLSFVHWLVEECGMWSRSALAAATSLDVVQYLHSYMLLHDKPPHDLCASNSTATIQDGASEALTWQLLHGLSADRFDKVRVDDVVTTERSFAWTQQRLGWNEYASLSTAHPHTPANMTRLRGMMRVFIDVYEPQFVRRITWLPKWAVQHGTLASLRRLEAIEHPNLFSPRTFRELLRTSKSEAKVQWFLNRMPRFFSWRVVRWAVEHDRRRFLVWLCRKYLPSQPTLRTNVDTNEVTARSIRQAHRLAQKHGRIEIAAWAATQQ